MVEHTYDGAYTQRRDTRESTYTQREYVCACTNKHMERYIVTLKAEGHT